MSRPALPRDGLPRSGRPRDDIPADEPPRGRRGDLGVALPAAALVLLCPPLVGLLADGGPVWGMPRAVAYLFGLWIAMIAGAAALAWVLRRR